jgi:hypothetical protein
VYLAVPRRSAHPVQFTLGHPEIGQLRDDLFKILSEKQGS